MNFSNSLMAWYLQNKRDLPWRNTTHPYPIWLSEIMLQQTRVAQAEPFFKAFLAAFPTVFDLAKANEEQVLKLWQGLGYYSRARNMHKTAQIVANDFKGVFPNNYNDLLKLKGIGNYTAAAIASFSYNEVVPVVDGNVYRVLSRYFNIDSDISLPKTKKEFTNIAHELIPNDNPAMFNQAIMEFGAIQCVPKNPNCTLCIFNSSCAALQKNKIGQLPFKSKKIKVANRFFNYLVFHDQENATILRKRVENGIWHNLYEFPVIETNKLVDFETIKLEIENKFKQYSIDSISIFNEKPIIHKLSHQHLNICFYHIQLNDKLVDGITSENINNFPIPVVISNFIEKHLY